MPLMSPASEINCADRACADSYISVGSVEFSSTRKFVSNCNSGQKLMHRPSSQVPDPGWESALVHMERPEILAIAVNSSER
jgi:hypothetical protein